MPAALPLAAATGKAGSFMYNAGQVPMEVEGARAHIRAMALDGHVIETIELTAPESPAPAAKQ